MKIFLFTFALFTTLSFVSCENNNSSSVKDEVVNTVTDGTWRITYFMDSEQDETSHFTGYGFTFGANNVLTATNGTDIYVGSWSLTSNSNDDSSDDLDFNISFASPDSFEDLSEDWHFLSRTGSKIQLRHISGGNGGTDFLTFEKN